MVTQSIHVRELCNRQKMASLYIELAKTSVDGIDVLKLRSKKTGILVYLAQVNGPSVDGFVCLGKESRLCCRHFIAVLCHHRASRR